MEIVVTHQLFAERMVTDHVAVCETVPNWFHRSRAFRWILLSPMNLFPSLCVFVGTSAVYVTAECIALIVERRLLILAFRRSSAEIVWLMKFRFVFFNTFTGCETCGVLALAFGLLNSRDVSLNHVSHLFIFIVLFFGVLLLMFCLNLIRLWYQHFFRNFFFWCAFLLCIHGRSFSFTHYLRGHVLNIFVDVLESAGNYLFKFFLFDWLFCQHTQLHNLFFLQSLELLFEFAVFVLFNVLIVVLWQQFLVGKILFWTNLMSILIHLLSHALLLNLVFWSIMKSGRLLEILL